MKGSRTRGGRCGGLLTTEYSVLCKNHFDLCHSTVTDERGNSRNRNTEAVL